MTRDSPTAQSTDDEPREIGEPREIATTRSSQTRERETGDLATDETIDSPRGPATSELPTGIVLDDVYRIKKLIGRGAMGAVYLAEHTTLGKEFAIKVVGQPGDSLPSDGAVKRLIREARTASAVEHDNIVNVTHLGRTDGGLPFVVMELLRGENLREHHIRVSGGDPDDMRPLDDVLVRMVGAQVLSALEAAHEAGVIHRDLKPDNIFLADKRGKQVAKLVDFGMSKVVAETKNVRLTKTGQILGTPLYMSPEQGKNNEEVDGRSDLYSVGVIIYEMLTGNVPFPAETIYECVFKHISEEPPPLGKKRPDLPKGVVDCVHRALSKDPDDRFQSAQGFREAWEAGWAGYLSLPDSDPDARLSDPSTTIATVAATTVASSVTGASRESSDEGEPSVVPKLLVAAAVALAVIATSAYVLSPSEDPPRGQPIAPVVVTQGAQGAMQEAAPETAQRAEEDLEPAPPEVVEAPHVVTVSSRPPASVSLDGESLGLAPVEVTIPEGADEITVRLSRRGYEAQDVSLSRQSPRELDVRLQARRPSKSAPTLAPR